MPGQAASQKADEARAEAAGQLFQVGQDLTRIAEEETKRDQKITEQVRWTVRRAKETGIDADCILGLMGVNGRARILARRALRAANCTKDPVGFFKQ